MFGCTQILGCFDNFCDFQSVQKSVWTFLKIPAFLDFWTKKYIHKFQVIGRKKLGNSGALFEQEIDPKESKISLKTCENWSKFESKKFKNSRNVVTPKQNENNQCNLDFLTTTDKHIIFSLKKWRSSHIPLTDRRRRKKGFYSLSLFDKNVWKAFP